MGYENEATRKVDLLNRCDALIRQLKMKGFGFRLSKEYRGLIKAYEMYRRAPTDEGAYLTASNRAFSEKLEGFEKSIGWKDDRDRI